MNDFTTIKIIGGLIFLAVVFVVYKMRNMHKPELYETVAKKFSNKRAEFFNKAMELYPSAHLTVDSSEWEKAVDEQTRYLENKSEQYAIELQRVYNLTDTDWKRVLNLYLQENKK